MGQESRVKFNVDTQIARVCCVVPTNGSLLCGIETVLTAYPYRRIAQFLASSI